MFLGSVRQHRVSHAFFPAGAASLALLVLGLFALALALACGSNNGGNNFVAGCTAASGSFGNASLTGTWTYHITGNVLNFDQFGNLTGTTPYREAGVFTTDGNGNIKSGTDDLAMSGSAFSQGASFTGTYSIHGDGTGTLTINFGTQGGVPNTISLGIAMASSTQFYLIEADNFANAAGGGDKQSSTAMPTGTFVFGAHANGTAQGSNGRVGVITVSNTGVVSGSEDSLALGSLASQLTLTGSLTAPDSTGRGTLTLKDSSNASSDFEYYVIDTNTLLFLESDGLVGSGRAEKQTNGSFTNASFTAGGWAFGSTGDTSANLNGVHTVGALTSDGNGNITGGAYDSAQDGTAIANLAFTGGYTVGAAGRTQLTLNPTGSAAISEVYYLVSPTRAFFLVNDPTKVEDGTADQQSTNSFSNSNLSGQYALVMDGFDSTPELVDRVATLQGDGKGNLNFNELVSDSGSTNTPGCLTGNYTVAGNGRVSAAITNLSSNLVIYMASPNKGYILQDDTGVEVSGTIALQ